MKQTRKPIQLKKIFLLPEIYLILSILFYLVSLTQTAFYVGESKEEFVIGFYCVSMGWLSVGSLSLFLSWLANPILYLSWLISMKVKLKVFFSSISLLFSLLFLFQDKVIVNEALGEGTITRYGWGYFFLGVKHSYLSNRK